MHVIFGVHLTSIDATGYDADEAAELWRGVYVDGAAYAVKLSGGGTGRVGSCRPIPAEHEVAVVRMRKTRPGRAPPQPPSAAVLTRPVK